MHFPGRGTSAAAAVVLAMLLAGGAHATPANKASFERHFERFLAKNLKSCTTCHLPSEKKNPESLEEFPHNPFGARLRAVKDEAKSRDVAARFERIAGEDADGDGVDNLTELLLGHAPGDNADKPAVEALSQREARHADFDAFLKSYRWRPFESVKRLDVPSVQNSAWVRNPVDAFIAGEHERRGLRPRPEAPKQVLLRRVYLDLIGLSPTPAEIAAFERDSSADAYEKVVERLLADPRYGERWGRHWMDVWRYSDWAGWTDGGQVRDSQPHIWRWRDWIIESLNKDKGYDRMVIEMLAADEVAPEDADALRATGFLARNYKMLSREQWLEDTVNHTSRAFLGVTVHCAKCHDHMYDAVSQEEYYRFRAVFEPHNVRIDRVPGETDTKKDGLPRVYDKDLDAKTYFFVRGDERKPDKERGEMTPAVPKLLGAALAFEPVTLPRLAVNPDRREFVIKDIVAAARKSEAEAKQAHEKVKDDKSVSDQKKLAAQTAWSVADAKLQSLLATLAAEKLADEGKKESEQWKHAAREALARQRNVAVLEAVQTLLTAQHAKGEKEAKLILAAKAGDKPALDKLVAELEATKGKVAEAEKAVAKASQELAQELSTAYKPRSTESYPDKTTGRRLALARSIVDRNNPLAARVAVNHIWLRHFGRGIVPSVDDFGANGRLPSHPALLDWLAVEFMEYGWSMKHIHRLLVTSSTYRMASTPDEANARIDDDNIFLWRMPSRRMDAEVVRDNVLFASGELDSAMGGPEIDHSQGLTSKRRSVYLRIAAEKEVEFLKIFDGPAVTECYERKYTVVPQQALALGNSDLVARQAKVLAKSLADQSGDDAGKFVEGAFLRILARRPTEEEASECASFLRGKTGDAIGEARLNLVMVLFNHNDFVTVR